MMQNNSVDTNTQPITKAFVNAFNGLKTFFKKERNGKIQATITIAVLIAGISLHLSSTEWIVVLLCIGSVLALEMINSALENICNLVSNEYHPSIKYIKDVAAGAVLFASIISTVIALIIFLPKILLLL